MKSGNGEQTGRTSSEDSRKKWNRKKWEGFNNCLLAGYTLLSCFSVFHSHLSVFASLLILTPLYSTHSIHTSNAMRLQIIPIHRIGRRFYGYNFPYYLFIYFCVCPSCDSPLPPFYRFLFRSSRTLTYNDSITLVCVSNMNEYCIYYTRGTR